ncbi:MULTISPECIES: TrsD/TraD family conjugative transfer protein [Lactobacillales]|uniref:TrsD/TraD family conjugative transfer protein n=1 Tax=Lactobacillales TaxID=186826 RepID=UPI00065FC98E|nr:TrsD/TraD family conjugative transfer protein [Carnobacterium sp. 1290_CSPC]
MNLFKSKDKENTKELTFTWQPRPINKKGKETINDMSLIQSTYQDILITKTGYAVGMIEISGINLELLNDEEQTDTFDTFNTFLINTLGDSSNEVQQWIDTTSPVNIDDYLLSYKKRYLMEENEAKKQLIASYIQDLTQKSKAKEMNTKRHILIVKEKITDKSLVSLETKAQDLKDKIRNYISRLENSFEQYDLQAKQLFADEVKQVLKNQMNYNGK